VVCAISAADVYIPPMTIFKTKNWNNAFEIGVPPGNIIKISETGYSYINAELFILVPWLEHYKNHTNCSKDKGILLLLDGHGTNGKNLAAMNFHEKTVLCYCSYPGTQPTVCSPLT
jgi:hypothetical protein